MRYFIGNAHLEYFTKEKVFIKFGPEFGSLQGQNLIINKDLHMLRTSGLRWNERLDDYLRDIAFKQCKMDPAIWLKDCEDYYEHVAICVDDLLIESKDPQTIIHLS